jgi:hypothetical protein
MDFQDTEKDNSGGERMVGEWPRLASGGMIPLVRTNCEYVPRRLKGQSWRHCPWPTDLPRINVRV